MRGTNHKFSVQLKAHKYKIHKIIYLIRKAQIPYRNIESVLQKHMLQLYQQMLCKNIFRTIGIFKQSERLMCIKCILVPQNAFALFVEQQTLYRGALQKITHNAIIKRERNQMGFETQPSFSLIEIYSVIKPRFRCYFELEWKCYISFIPVLKCEAYILFDIFNSIHRFSALPVQFYKCICHPFRIMLIKYLYSCF